MRTEAQIQEDIARMQQELEIVRAEEAKRAVLPEDKRLAIVLHDSLCYSDHNDRCGWEWERDWSGYAHKDYLKKAKAVLDETKMDLDAIVTVIKALP